MIISLNSIDGFNKESIWLAVYTWVALSTKVWPSFVEIPVKTATLPVPAVTSCEVTVVFGTYRPFWASVPVVKIVNKLLLDVPRVESLVSAIFVLRTAFPAVEVSTVKPLLVATSTVCPMSI